MTNLENKYKDRNPKDTIQIIKNFFEDKLDLKIEITNLQESESNTWWCHLVLFLDDYEILATNGKGTSKEYCLASGYAELYERFCSGLYNRFYNPFVFEEVKKYNLEKYGYEISPNEKIISLDDMLNVSLRINAFIKNIDYNNYFDTFYKRLHQHYIGLPYQKLTNREEEIIYISPDILLRVCGSDGLAAGNTVEEACVQGISEIFEHYVWDQLYLDRQKTYYILDISKLNLSDKNKNIIEKIKNIGYDLHIYDLSYNYNVPVIMSVCVDKITHGIFINLGAAPVFEIALERSLTELYQGHFNLTKDLNKEFMVPNKDINDYTILNLQQKYASTITSRILYPEYIFTDVTIIDKFNDEYFLDNNNYNNEELLYFLKNISDKNNWDIYWTDLSLIPEIKAVQVFATNKEVYQWKRSMFDNLLDKDKEILYNFIDKYIFYFKTAYKEKNIDHNFKFLKSVNQSFNDYLYTELEGYNLEDSILIKKFFISNILCANFTNIFRREPVPIYYFSQLSDERIRIDLLAKDFINGNKNKSNLFFKYFDLFLYKSESNYTDDELKKYYKFRNITFDDEDYINILNRDYFFNKICLEPYFNLISSDSYKKYISVITGDKYKWQKAH